jgi:hypothetical protein
MKVITMTDKEKQFKPEERDPDFVSSEIAIRRAAKRARELAQQKGTYVVIFQDGEIREVKPDEDVA